MWLIGGRVITGTYKGPEFSTTWGGGGKYYFLTDV